MCRKLIKFIVSSWEFIDYKPQTTNHEPRTTNRSAGFTLTEVVVASALLIVAIVPILKALTSANLSTAIIERKTRSLMLAEAKLEEIKARSIYNYDPVGSFIEINTVLEGSYMCNVMDTAVSNELRSIRVEVGYDLNGSGLLGSDEVLVTLSTLLARRQ